VLGYNATAVSSESLIVGQGQGLRFCVPTVDHFFILGFGRFNSAPSNFAEIDYAAHIRYNVLHGFEVDMRIGSYDYSANDIIELRVTNTQVLYIVNGDLKFTSNLRGEAELFVMASFVTPGSEALEIQWL
jgi:hypothetical protein